ncbi:amino acid synthesis family protein [Phytohabitans sp. ZYX-F-186]|uniref:Amino acid synthesis family protein n=1 Tax=Phytohabitans maris TaxID=3071409 RepID=A0ABU0ZVX0_9ACTN|nr:amino acid synthesis family protein [Phytohabitans sp. ZYX-F-186]MDQ7911127.1 amino acid synthesis family protein [Phytohabitans sp. ZYX-F-186]
MIPELRKVSVVTEDLVHDEDRAIDGGWRTVVAAAVIANPWYGRGFVENLSPEALPLADSLGRLLAEQVVAGLGGPDRLQAYGRAAMVGLGGEIEHTSAIIHTPSFGNAVRSVTGSKSLLYSTNSRATAGTCVTLPGTHRDDDSLRDYYMSFDIVLVDAPRDDEIVVALGGASGPRPFARLGNRAKDREAMAAEAAAGKDDTTGERA